MEENKKEILVVTDLQRICSRPLKLRKIVQSATGIF